MQTETLCAPDSPLAGILKTAVLWAARACPVFIQGESGTGKEVIAGFLHRHSPRAQGPFVAVNCAAIAPSLAESELFGHRRGAFTGALSDRLGHIQRADSGTLFLDEIGDMPLELQARLLRVLQEKRVCPLGGDEEKPVDFRLLCATHRDLTVEMRAGRFREDLYYRLKVLELRIPPLRDRPMDIPFLLRKFLAELLGPENTEEALRKLPGAVLRHAFPGNVRELRNLAERYSAWLEAGGDWESALREEDAVRPASDFPAGGAPRNSRLSEGDIRAALATCGHHRGRAAEKLGVTRRALQYRLAKMQTSLQALY
jgi:DNA-binding NtrC family response regulator